MRSVSFFASEYVDGLHRSMSAKHVFETVAAIQRLCASLCEHTTFVLLTPARTMTIIDKITILCNDVNKASTSIELLAIHVLHYMSKRSHVGLGIKSMAGLKAFMVECYGHNAFAQCFCTSNQV